MTLLALSVSLTLALHPLDGVTGWQLDISPTILIEANVYAPPGRLGGAITLPHVIIASAPALMRGWTRHLGGIPGARGLINHEMEHIRQWQHLGPGFGLAYVLMPSAFEPYLGSPDPPWTATKNLCPLLRLSNHQLSLLPCYRP